MSSQFQSLKVQLNAQRERQRQMLCRLTVQSNDSLKHLRSVAEQGERLLRLAELGRKYECEAEKVLPFYTCSLSPEELEDVRAALTEGAPLATTSTTITSLNFNLNLNLPNSIEYTALVQECKSRSPRR